MGAAPLALLLALSEARAPHSNHSFAIDTSETDFQVFNELNEWKVNILSRSNHENGHLYCLYCSTVYAKFLKTFLRSMHTTIEGDQLLCYLGIP